MRNNRLTSQSSPVFTGDTSTAPHARRTLQRAMDRVYPNRWRLLVVVGIVVLALSSRSTGEVVVSALGDAFLAVTVFVAATFVLVFSLERLFAVDLGILMARNRLWQPAFASLLGILPGCGGAIVVVTQYTRGYAGFGALIAVLVSTMGDAAFLLLAREPITALYVFAISAVAGTITGLVVDYLHGYNYMSQPKDTQSAEDIVISSHIHSRRLNGLQKFWFFLVAIGLVLGVAIAFQVNVEDWFLSYSSYEPVRWFGFSSALLCLLMWATVHDGHSVVGADTMPSDPIAKRIVMDTNFVTSWVVLAFLSYEIVALWGFDISVFFGQWHIWVVMIAIVIGFIPGCGPQIVVTSLYLSGAIPFSALIANAIANDGDALFPALALAPRAALLATLYSAIPAFFIGTAFFIYGF